MLGMLGSVVQVYAFHKIKQVNSGYVGHNGVGVSAIDNHDNMILGEEYSSPLVRLS